MAKGKTAAAERDKILRKKRRKVKQDEVLHRPTVAEQLHTDMHLLQRTFGNEVLGQLMQRQPHPKTPDHESGESVNSGIQHILQRTPAGQSTNLATQSIPPYWVQRQDEEGGKAEEEEEPEFDDIEQVEGPGEGAVVKTLASRGNLKHTSREQTTEVAGKTKQKETKTVQGSGVALKKILEADSTTMRRAVLMMAQAGWFGEQVRKTETAKGTTEATISGQAGASARAGASAKVDTDASGLVQAVQLLAAANLIVGVGGELHLRKTRKLGNRVELEASKKLQTFAGFAASAHGKLDIDVLNKQISLQGGASAMAGAQASGEIAGKISMGDTELLANAQGEAFAGVKGDVRGKLAFGLEGVELAAKASAFAGASAEAKFGGSLGYRGTPLVSASGGISVNAGVGGKIGGTFKFVNGKLTIGGALGLSLGLGAGIEFEVTIDFIAIANAIQDLIVGAIVSRRKKQLPLPPELGTINFDVDADDEADYTEKTKGATQDTMQLFDFVQKALVNFGLRKYAHQKSKGGAHYMKRENVQLILNQFKQQYGQNPTVRNNAHEVAQLLAINIMHIGNEKAPMFDHMAVEVNDQFELARFRVNAKRGK